MLLFLMKNNIKTVFDNSVILFYKLICGVLNYHSCPPETTEIVFFFGGVGGVRFFFFKLPFVKQALARLLARKANSF